MKIAVMQPYFLPYVGYFQLINSVDKFISFDDVKYKKQGWTNRNNILCKGTSKRFTLPVKNASQNILISKTETAIDDEWREKFLKTLKQCYVNAPYYSTVYNLMELIVFFRNNNLSAFIRNSLQKVTNYLSINTEIVGSSNVYDNQDFKGQERIIDICKQEKADEYINLPGGKDLYDKKRFMQEGIKLSFLQTDDIQYKQFNDTFVPSLSIIDVIMFNDVETSKNFLKCYTLE